jgi:hypothetical protein
MQIERVFLGKQTPAEFVKTAAADIHKMDGQDALYSEDVPHNLPPGAAGLVVPRWAYDGRLYKLGEMRVWPALGGGLQVRLAGADEHSDDLSAVYDWLAAAHVARGGRVSELSAAPAAALGLVQDFALLKTDELKRHFADYSPPKGREILNALPAAYKRWAEDGGRWGPGIIGREIATNPTTVGRYLKAFRAIGLKQWAGVRFP